MIFALWSSRNHIPIKSRGPIKKSTHLRTIYPYAIITSEQVTAHPLFLQEKKSRIDKSQLPSNKSKNWILKKHNNSTSPQIKCEASVLGVMVSGRPNSLVKKSCVGILHMFTHIPTHPLFSKYLLNKQPRCHLWVVFCKSFCKPNSYRDLKTPYETA